MFTLLGFGQKDRGSFESTERFVRLGSAWFRAGPASSGISVYILGVLIGCVIRGFLESSGCFFYARLFQVVLGTIRVDSILRKIACSPCGPCHLPATFTQTCISSTFVLVI